MVAASVYDGPSACWRMQILGAKFKGALHDVHLTCRPPGAVLKTSSTLQEVC